MNNNLYTIVHDVHAVLNIGRLAFYINERKLVYAHTIVLENLCVARCRHDYGLRSSLALEVKGQMSIVTVLPDVSAQSKSPCHVPLIYH